MINKCPLIAGSCTSILYGCMWCDTVDVENIDNHVLLSAHVFLGVVSFSDYHKYLVDCEEKQYVHPDDKRLRVRPISHLTNAMQAKQFRVETFPETANSIISVKEGSGFVNIHDFVKSESCQACFTTIDYVDQAKACFSLGLSSTSCFTTQTSWSENELTSTLTSSKDKRNCSTFRLLNEAQYKRLISKKRQMVKSKLHLFYGDDEIWRWSLADFAFDYLLWIMKRRYLGGQWYCYISILYFRNALEKVAGMSMFQVIDGPGLK